MGLTMALAGQGASAWIVGSLVSAKWFDVQTASLTNAAEMVTMGCTMVVFAPLVTRLPRRSSIAAAIAAILLTQLVSIMLTGFWPIVIIRALSGVAFGALFSLAAAIGAGTRIPDRTFAVAGSVTLIIGTAINPMLGAGSAHAGPAGVFLGLFVFCLGIAISMGFLLFRLKTPLPVASPNVDADNRHLWGPAAIGVLAIMSMMAAATNGLFIFLTTIAERVGLHLTELGLGMAAVSLFSATGGVIGNRIGLRFGYAPPLVLGFAAHGISLFVLANAHSQLIFWVSFTAVVTIYWFVFPYILGLSARIDPFGRVSSVTGTAKIFAGAAGSALGGFVAGNFGIAAYGALAFACCAAAAGLSILVVRLVGMLAKEDGEGFTSAARAES